MPIIGFIGADTSVVRSRASRSHVATTSLSAIRAAPKHSLHATASRFDVVEAGGLKESWRIEPNTPGYGPRRTPRRWERAWRRQSVGCRGMRALRRPTQSRSGYCELEGTTGCRRLRTATLIVATASSTLRCSSIVSPSHE